MPVTKIISGGQTGADRAGLDFAIASGIPHGGWCPKGRLAEDGPIPDRYQLRETDTTDYPPRTRKNVEEADATLIIIGEPTISRGSKLTAGHAVRVAKPFLVIASNGASAPEDGQINEVRTWLDQIRPTVLNIAGSRGSANPSVYDFTMELLKNAL